MNQSEVETIVYAARDYVVPTDDLRPETLHIAGELAFDRRAKAQLSCMLAALGLMVLVSLPIASRINELSLPIAPSAGEIQARAASISSDRTIGSHWALAEAYGRLRNAQANPKMRMSDF